MDFQQEHRPHLEPIQEESEVEDECDRGETEETQDKELQSPVGHGDDEEDELTVLRPRRVSRSCSQSFSQVQLNRSQQTETGQLSSSRQSISALPKRSFNFSRLRLHKHAPPKAPLRRQTTTRRQQKGHDEPFPKWLADLMINIEQAKSHPLVVE